MKLYELFHENSKEYIAEKNLTQNSLHEFDPVDNFYCKSIDGEEVKLEEDEIVELSQTIRNRKSTREFTGEPIELERISEILRNAYSVREDGPGFRVVPSAGASYPLEIYIAVFESSTLESGIYHYNMYKDALEKIKEGDFRDEMQEYSHGQDFIDNSSLLILMSATFKRTTYKYGERGYRYVFIEAGHVGQNIYLTCEELGLGICANGGFADNQMSQIFEMEDDEEPIYSLYIGHTDSFQDE